VERAPLAAKLIERTPDDIMRHLEAWLDASDYLSPADLDVMGSDVARRPPWGSKERLNRAGDAIRKGAILLEDAGYLDAWRASHRHVLNTFRAILRNRTRGKGIVVAQRLKRRITIVDKLNREPRMQLARMDDVAGCRMIFADLSSLKEFRVNSTRLDFVIVEETNSTNMIILNNQNH
jgi:hypothetical protein